ncbi:hypothetical protein BaRGS_00032445 [Batillaria attramentaria]|uniref:SWIM-type domain-containing protein n=1 Tax=Batillaria attramentaria TaxID=370345 RepID=A0ABD0JPD2_9CAEN
MSKPPAKRHKESDRYADQLTGPVKARYLEKIKLCGGVDPYSVSTWSVDDGRLPSLGYKDIVEYLMLKKSPYTREAFKAIKSLGAHNQVTSGWVKDVLSWSNRNPSHQGATPANTCVTGKVYHSQRLSDPPEQPWVIVSHDGEILTAHCRCQAGLGETCSHVAALLFTVEATVRIRDSTTVTQKPAYWNMPNFKEVAYLPAHKR